MYVALSWILNLGVEPLKIFFTNAPCVRCYELKNWLVLPVMVKSDLVVPICSCYNDGAWVCVWHLCFSTSRWSPPFWSSFLIPQRLMIWMTGYTFWGARVTSFELLKWDWPIERKCIFLMTIWMSQPRSHLPKLAEEPKFWSMVGSFPIKFDIGFERWESGIQ